MKSILSWIQRAVYWSVVVGACLLNAGIVFAGELGHYAPGLFNIRDFAMPPPGSYGAVYNYYYTTDRLNDRRGNKVSSVTIGPGPGVTLGVDVDVDIYVAVPTLIWASPWTILGGRYGALISPSLANVGLGASLATETGRGLNPEGSQFDLGDLYVQPVWLDWTLPHLDVAMSYGVYAPIGKYDVETVTFPIIGTRRVEAIDNIGFGFWTHQVQGAVTWYPMEHRGTALTAALTYEIHHKKEDIDVTPGSHVSLNWGVSQYVPLTEDQALLLEVGPTGYSQWQVTADTGSAANNNIHDQAHAAGVQIGLTYVPWNAAVNFHYLYEFASEDRFQGQLAVLSAAVKF